MTPVVIFAYQRPDHLKQSIDSLLLNEESIDTALVIFCDGFKNKNDSEGVQAVRHYVKGITGFKSVRIVERENNMGLAKSIISGVTELLEEHDRIIVLEDDLVVSPYFLSYMNQALSLYEQDETVASIHGYTYPVGTKLPETFFLKGADCWGWATWKRAWNIFEQDGSMLLDQLKKQDLCDSFDFDNSYPYTLMLKKQIIGENNSWAIRWHASIFLHEMYTLYPGQSLVHNTGNDHTGTHSQKSNKYDVKFSKNNIGIINKINILEDTKVKKVIRKYHLKTNWKYFLLTKFLASFFIDRLLTLKAYAK